VSRLQVILASIAAVIALALQFLMFVAGAARTGFMPIGQSDEIGIPVPEWKVTNVASTDPLVGMQSHIEVLPVGFLLDMLLAAMVAWLVLGLLIPPVLRSWRGRKHLDQAG
jgi:hypothetical protein